MIHEGLDGQEFVWVTRPRPQADEHARELDTAGLIPIISPVITIGALPVSETPPLAPEHADGLIFTSINGLLHFPQNWLDLFLDHPVFVTGPTTQRRALDMGFRHVLCSPGNGSQGLVPIIENTLSVALRAPQRKLLYVSGTSRTPTLETTLPTEYELIVVENYTAVLEQRLSRPAIQAFESQKVRAITLFSSRSAEQASTLLKGQFNKNADQLFASLLTVCISPAVAKRAHNSGFQNIAIATDETAESIVNKLVEQLKIHSNSFKSH